MNIVALKPCSFGGKQYFNGDLIPEKEIVNVDSLRRMGVISVIKEGVYAKELPAYQTVDQGKPVLFHVPVTKGDETLDLAVSETEMAEAYKIMQMNAEAAVAHIRASVEDGTVLILLDAADSRATVKKAAKAKAAKLAGTEENAAEESTTEESAGDS